MTPRRRAQIKAEAAALLARPVASKRPLQVELLARDLGIRVVFQPFESDEGDLSGFYMRRGDDQLIGVNASQARVRQRFTVAHELGHAVLQSGDGVHIDQAFKLRDIRSSAAVDADEIDANTFAAELLMPEDEVVAIIEQAVDITEDGAVREMARHFGVSQQALSFRLANLGFTADGKAIF
jgi:Zn-dependent peptidase ImmA (M78 family)